jgi:Cu-Zn family superoxide dismutase
MKKRVTLVAILGAVVGIAFAAEPDDATRAVAVLNPTAGQQTKGTVTFTRAGTKVNVTADLTGLPPNSMHGFHVHQFGDCTAPDAASAGDHFSPEKAPHAGPTTKPRHAGDFGNIQADASGKAHLELTVDDVSIATGDHMLIGRAVIVHANPDDLKTQPSGNAGARIACGVIGVANDAGKGG